MICRLHRYQEDTLAGTCPACDAAGLFVIECELDKQDRARTTLDQQGYYLDHHQSYAVMVFQYGLLASPETAEAIRARLEAASLLGQAPPTTPGLIRKRWSFDLDLEWVLSQQDPVWNDKHQVQALVVDALLEGTGAASVRVVTIWRNGRPARKLGDVTPQSMVKPEYEPGNWPDAQGRFPDVGGQQRVLQATFEPFPPHPTTVWRIVRALTWYGVRTKAASFLGVLARHHLVPRSWPVFPPVPCFNCGGVPKHMPPCVPYSFFGGGV